jgi:peptide/nickel transport system substrate-binding protein
MPERPPRLSQKGNVIMTASKDGVPDHDIVLPFEQRPFSRRQLLLAAPSAGLALSIGGLLASPRLAGAATLKHGVPSLPGGIPKRGGTLTAGCITSGSEENLFPGMAAANPDMARCYNLYNYLFYPNSGRNLYPLTPGLALAAESNKDATVWTLELRPNVVWHDGKPFTATDVVYNFQQLWGQAASNYSSAFLVGLVDFKNVKALDKLTVQVPLLAPSAQFPSILGFFNFGVLQEGATPASIAKNPVGTGPFKFESFTPGQQSVFVRNDDYWESGKPYVDRLVMDTSFTDNTALLDALRSGAVDLYIAPAPSQAREMLAGNQVQVLESLSATQPYMFGMRVDKGPFADNRVREAFKLLVNRQQIVNGALAGFGSVGNDLMGFGDQYYASDLTREHDLDKAKSLFKAAGFEGQTINWPTANAFPGMVESLTIFAEQAEAAGIKINVDTGAAGTYFTDADGAYTRFASQNVWQPSSSLAVNYMSALVLGAPYADTHWGEQKPGGAQANDLILKAMGTTNSSSAESLWHEVQLQQFNEGGYVIWGYYPYVDMAANNIRGLAESGGMNFNMFRFCDGWIA